MTLIVTFAPHEDESGRGFYRRLAAENGLAGWRELSGMADVPRTAGALLICPGHVAAELDLQPEWAQQATQQEQRARTWRALRRTTSEAVCPASLEEAPYLRAFWEHSFATACPKHRARLVDRCPDCGDLLSPNRPCIELCACGNDLRTVETSVSSSSQHWLSALIASNGEPRDGAVPSFESVDVYWLCDFVRNICRSMDLVAPPPPKGATRIGTIQEAVEFLGPLEGLLAEWPMGFKKHVSARIASGKSGARTLSTRLGGWYTRLKKSCEDTPLQPFLVAVLEVASEEFDGELPLGGAAYLRPDYADAMLVNEAAAALGVGWGQLHQAVTSGQCATTGRPFGKQRLLYYVPTSEVKRITSSRAEWISEEEACESAQVAPAVMRLMMQAEVVESDAKWSRDILKGGVIRKASLEALCQRLCGTANARRRTDAAYVSWSDLSSRRMGDKHAIQCAMKAAANGELQPAFRGRRLGDTSFSKADLSKYFGTPVLEAGMSVQDLSERTGWKWESISHWIETGLLGAEQITLRGQPCRVITAEQVLAFRQMYLPLADLAKSMGTKSSYLADQLSTIEILGAKVLPNGTRRGALLRVADLGRLALQAAQSMPA